MEKAAAAETVPPVSGGILRTSDALDAGFTKDRFYQFVRQNGLEKVAHGIYIFPDTLLDEMYVLQLRFPKAVFSYDTALYLHDMAEMEPMPLTVSVPARYNAPALLDKAKVNYVKNEWYCIGITEALSPDGHPLRVYDKERTICDIIRKRESIDAAVFNYAVNQYVRSKDRDYVRLMQYARQFRIEGRIHTVMGVLL